MWAFADDWERDGEFDLTVPPDGGVRFLEHQRALYARGRTEPGRIVTYAATHEESAHGHAAAGDFLPVRTLFPNGLPATVYTGDEDDPFDRAQAMIRFQTMAQFAERLGYRSGGRFPHPDWPHIEVENWRDLPVVKEEPTA